MARKETKTAKASASKGSKASASSPVNYPVVDGKGKEVGTVELDASVFAAPLSEAVVFDAVMWQLSKRRQGTHSVLTKGVMRGGGRKPWRQKGTGRARAGSNTSPLWVGGAVAHGPKSNPFGYENRLSKRSKRQALAAALTDKVNQKGLIVLDSLALKSARTKDLSKVLSALGCPSNGLSARSILLCAGSDLKAMAAGKAAKGEKPSPVVLAARNVKGLQLLPVEGLNVHEVLKAKYLIGTKEQVIALQGELLKRFSSAATK